MVEFKRIYLFLLFFKSFHFFSLPIPGKFIHLCAEGYELVFAVTVPFCHTLKKKIKKKNKKIKKIKKHKNKSGARNQFKTKL
jgi:hypothetical protein